MTMYLDSGSSVIKLELFKLLFVLEGGRSNVVHFRAGPRSDARTGLMGHQLITVPNPCIVRPGHDYGFGTEYSARHRWVFQLGKPSASRVRLPST
jgi:hypothetical protein